MNHACLLSPAEMARADRLAIAGGVCGPRLMESAGEHVARAAARMASRGPIAALCGPGDNGGDGYVAARILRAGGARVRLFASGAPRPESNAADAKNLWTGAIEPLDRFDPQNFSLAIDALFGAGLSRDLAPEIIHLAQSLNEERKNGLKILSVDVPSGIDGATGQICGAAVEADETVTFFRLKPGHLLLPGRLLCGKLNLVDIGIPKQVLGAIAPKCFHNGPKLWGPYLKTPSMAGNKFSRGSVLALSGGPTSTGAGRLAARAALRAGAGLVTLASPANALLVNAAHLTAIMLQRCDDAEDLGAILRDRRLNAVVLGPALGLGEKTIGLVQAALTPCPGRAVALDADALSVFADRPETLFAAIKNFGGSVVMTPHGGEFSRLFHRSADKLADARAAAKISGAVIVSKGADTVIAAPDGRAAINDNAPAWLATAGAGDVLAGIVAALLAQGAPAFEAAACAVWLHGAAAQLLGWGLIAEDLPEILPKILQRLHNHDNNG